MGTDEAMDDTCCTRLTARANSHEERIIALEAAQKMSSENILLAARESRHFHDKYDRDEISRTEWRSKMELDNSKIIGFLEAASTSRKIVRWVYPFLLGASACIGLYAAIRALIG